MYSILVAGAGYLGSEIARQFKAKKQKVFALTRNSEKAKELEAQEIQPILADLTRPETLSRLPPAHFIVLSAAPDVSSEEAYRRIYLQGTSNLLEAVRGNPRPHLLVQISSTSVWKDHRGEWVEESMPADPKTEKGKILLESEKRVLQSGIPSAVLRLSGIYGPGRNRLKSLHSGVWPASSLKDAYMNMIYVEDAAASLQPFFKSAKEGEIYIGSDDEPVLRSEFCKWLGERAGISVPPVKVSGQNQGKRLSNQKWKALGIKLQHPTFREGYAEILNQEKIK